MLPQQINELRSVYDMLSLKGKTALITGGAGGIGRSCAAALAELGADIALVDVPAREEVLAGNCGIIAEKYGVKAAGFCCDVSKERDVEETVAGVVREFGRLDVVFSNAGIGGKNDCAPEMELDEWRRVIDINLTGMFLVDRISANAMKKLGNGGSIINTASMSGHIINKGSRKDMSKHMAAYSAAKAGVIQLTKSVALSYVDDGIRCNSISPGMILSGLHDTMDMNALMEFVEDMVPMNRFARLDEIVGIVVYLATGLSSYATGSDFIVDGGVTSW